MNKIIIAFASLALIILIIIYLQPIHLDNDLLIPANDVHDEYVTKIGLNANELLNEQKQIIYTRQLEFLEEFHSIDYVYKGFVRPNNYPLKTNQQTTSEFTGYLLVDNDGKYHLMLNYSTPVNPVVEKEDYIGINLTPHYTIDNRLHKSFISYKNYEYEYNNHWMNQQNNIYRLPTINFSQYFKRPRHKGFVWLELASDDYQFIEIIVNTYQLEIEPQAEQLMLGFNLFNSKKNNYYIGNSYRLIYNPEEN